MNEETISVVMELGETKEDKILASQCLEMHRHELTERISMGCVHNLSPEKGFFITMTVAGLAFSVSRKRTGAIAIRDAWDMFEIGLKRHSNKIESDKAMKRFVELLGPDVDSVFTE